MTSLDEMIPRMFDEAVASGELVFTASEVHYIREGPFEFEIRIAPGLLKKPQISDNNSPQDDSSKPRDPFSPPYSSKLLIREYQHHALLFNKFSVCREHLLVVTKDFHKQTDPITLEDFAVTWEVMQERRKREYIAFYNCGDESGASQPHKHIQLIPGDVQGRKFYPPVMWLISDVKEKPGTIFRIPEYKFIHGCLLLDETRVSPSVHRAEAGAYLSAAYAALLGNMFDAVHSHRASSMLCSSKDDSSAFSAAAFISYNLIFTFRFMLLVPRSREKFDNVSLNSVAYAGLVLLKERAQLDTIKSFADVLVQLALPHSELGHDGGNRTSLLSRYTLPEI